MQTVINKNIIINRYGEITKRLDAGTKTPIFNTVTQAVAWVSQETDNVHKPISPACFLASSKGNNWSISYEVYQINSTAKAVVWVREVEENCVIYNDWLSVDKFNKINVTNHEVMCMMSQDE